MDLDLEISVNVTAPALVVESPEPEDIAPSFTLDGPLTGKYLTGWCESGAHEGKPMLTKGGSLMTPCRGTYHYPRLVKPYITCGCWCHELFRKAQAMLGVPADAVSDHTPMLGTAVSVDYVPPKWHATTPIPDVDLPIPGPVVPATQNIYDRLYKDTRLTSHLARMLEKHCGVQFTATDREARTRGSLDVNVETVCRMLADKIIPFPVAEPQIIAMLIDPDAGISPGAVHACLERFIEAGYMVGGKPVRFYGFSGNAISMTVSECRAEDERRAKRLARGGY